MTRGIALLSAAATDSNAPPEGDLVGERDSELEPSSDASQGSADRLEDGSSPGETKEGDVADDDPDLLLCAQCGSNMASMATCEGSKVQPNPGGMPMYISKFSSAPGAEAPGPAQSEDSFFPGWTWRMGLCRSCGAHVGWLYESADQPSFWGLLLNRLEKNRSAL